MKAQFAQTWENLRSNFWFVPTLMVIGAAMLALALIYVDATVLGDTLPPYLAYIYGGGPEGARSVLSTVAGSVIGVAGTTFSITIAALALASSQFGPRLLNNFVRDRGNQLVLGTYIATFTYCLLVLRTIRSVQNDTLVPHLSVTVGVLLALVNLGVLIYFINHIATTIQVSHIIATIGSDVGNAIERLFPEKVGLSASDFDEELDQKDLDQQFEQQGHAIIADKGGYVQFIDSDAVFNLAVEHESTIQLLHRPGDYMIGGSDLAFVYPDERADDDLAHALNIAFAVGPERTKQQDIQFSFDQLVEIAVRALSPGINDPFTAITCVNELGEALCRLAKRDFPVSRRYDEQKHLRVCAEAITFEQLVNASFDKIRNYARDSPAVTLRMLDVLTIIMKRTHTQLQRDALLRQAKMIERGSEQGLVEENDRAAAAASYAEVLRVYNRKTTREQSAVVRIEDVR